MRKIAQTVNSPDLETLARDQPMNHFLRMGFRQADKAIRLYEMICEMSHVRTIIYNDEPGHLRMGVEPSLNLMASLNESVSLISRNFVEARSPIFNWDTVLSQQFHQQRPAFGTPPPCG